MHGVSAPRFTSSVISPLQLSEHQRPLPTLMVTTTQVVMNKEDNVEEC